jgi:phosphatidylserine synthase
MRGFLGRPPCKVILNRLMSTPFEAWVATLAVVSCITFLADANALEQSSVGQVFHPWDWVWNVGFGVSGVLTLIGVIKVWQRLEIAGLTGVAISSVIQFVSIWSVRGVPGTTAICTYIGIVLACLGRGSVLASGRDVILTRYSNAKNHSTGEPIGEAYVDLQPAPLPDQDDQNWKRRAGRGPT